MPSADKPMERSKGMVVSIYSYNGGVWKTTLAINLATSLVKSGYRLPLLVDADSCILLIILHISAYQKVLCIPMRCRDQ
jgi:septum formation inhibitor-activating ATPase MinD